MPIKGLTDRVRVPRLDKIRLGVKDPARNNAPKNMPYFVVPDELRAVYGDEPTELKIVFLTDDEEQIVSQYYRSYNASHGRICMGDGERADALLDADFIRSRDGDVTPDNADLWAHGNTRGRRATENVVRRDIDCRGAECPMFERKDCGVKMFMQFAVVGSPRAGVYQLDTGSVINIGNINGAIRLVKMMANGHVAGIPFILKRTKTEVAPPPARKKTTQWTVSLEVDPALNVGQLLTAATASPVAALLGASMPAPDESEAAEIYDDREEYIDVTPTDAPVAQRTEQVPSKDQAAGSNPAGGAPDDEALRAFVKRKYERVKSTLGDRDKADLDELIKADGMTVHGMLQILNTYEPEPPVEQPQQAAMPV